MAKDQNAFAKRQREMNKKLKKDQKKERRAKRKQEGDESSEPETPQTSLSPEECSVLTLFRNYLMVPGKMLCLSKPDQTSFLVPLAQLTRSGLLISEKPPGAYSLTEAGFEVMQDCE